MGVGSRLLFLVVTVLMLGLPAATVAYVTPTGSFSATFAIHSKAVQDYSKQIGTVNKSIQEFQDLGNEMMNRKWSSMFIETFRALDSDDQQAMVHRLAAASKALTAEFSTLKKMQDTATDYQLLESFSEPFSANSFWRKGVVDLVTEMCQTQTDMFMELIEGQDQPLKVRDLIAVIRSLRKCLKFKNAGNPLSRRTITAAPFTQHDFDAQAEAVQVEYGQLLVDHDNLIVECGADFKDFEEKSKCIFLRELHDIEDRWDIIFERYQLMQVLNPEYVRQTNNYLASYGLDEEQYRTLRRANAQKLLNGDGGGEGLSMSGAAPRSPAGRRFGTIRRLAKRPLLSLQKLLVGRTEKKENLATSSQKLSQGSFQ